MARTRLSRLRLKLASLLARAARRLGVRDKGLVVFEMPILMLLTAALASIGRGLHEALLELSMRPPRGVLSYMVGLGREYRRLLAQTMDSVLALRRLSERVRSSWLRTFLRNYIAVVLSRGNVLDYVERRLQLVIRLVEDHVRARLDATGTIMEVLVMLSSVVVFVIVLSSASIEAGYLAVTVSSLASVAASMLLRLRIVEAYVKPVRWWEQALLAATPALMLGYSLAAGPARILVAGVAVASSAAQAALNIKAYLGFRDALASFRPVFESLQLGAETAVRGLTSLPSEAKYVLKTGLAPQRASSPMAAVLALVMAEVVKGGSRAARAAGMVLDFLDSVEARLSMVIRYGLLYEALALATYLAFAISYAALSTVMLSPLPGPLPGQVLAAKEVAPLLLASTGSVMASIAGIVWGNGGSLLLPALLALDLLGVTEWLANLAASSLLPRV